MENRLSDEAITKSLLIYRQCQLRQPENQTTDIVKIFETLEEQKIPVSKELSLFLTTFEGRLTHIIPCGYGIDVVAYRPDYCTTLNIFNNGRYSIISEYYKKGKRIVRHLV